MNRTGLFIAFSVVATVALVAYVTLQLDASALRDHLNPRALAALAPALPLYGLILIVRGARISLVARRYESANISIFDGLRITTLLSLGHHILPFRLGEGVFVFLTRSVFGMRVAEGTGMLVTLRLYDMLALVTVSAVGLSLLPGAGGIRFAGYALVVVLFVAAVRLDAVFAFCTRLLHMLQRKTRAPIAPVVRFAERLSESSQHARDPSFVAIGFGTSLAIWLSFALYFGGVLRSYGHSVEISKLLVASVATSVAAFIPASALGTFGPLEAGWTAAFTWAGLESADAAASGIAMHLATVAILTALSVVFVFQLWPRIASARAAAQEENSTC